MEALSKKETIEKQLPMRSAGAVSHHVASHSLTTSFTVSPDFVMSSVLF